MLNKLTAISPVDGRYRNTTETLADYFSEQALIRYRIRVEVEYFIALCEIPLPQLAGIDRTKFAALRALYLDFSPADAERVKQIESVTNHDVKAIEYIIKEKMDTLGLEAYKEFVHFGLTSQDINNTAIPLSLKEAMAGFYYTLPHASGVSAGSPDSLPHYRPLSVMPGLRCRSSRHLLPVRD